MLRVCIVSRAFFFRTASWSCTARPWRLNLSVMLCAVDTLSIHCLCNCLCITLLPVQNRRPRFHPSLSRATSCAQTRVPQYSDQPCQCALLQHYACSHSPFFLITASPIRPVRLFPVICETACSPLRLSKHYLRYHRSLFVPLLLAPIASFLTLSRSQKSALASPRSVASSCFSVSYYSSMELY